MVGWLLLGLAWAAPSHAWRDGGDGVVDGASAAAPARRWSAPLGPGNGSPVVVGELVCATEEPVSLVCVRAATGELAWRRSHPVLDALPEAERARYAEPVKAAEAWWQERGATLAALSQARRAARAGDADAAAKAEALKARVEAADAAAAAVGWALPLADREMIGWATPSPVSDGERVYALFGTGVLVARDAAGTRVWTRWLGEARGPMRGYEAGTSTSLLLVDGVLVAAHGALRGVDPATGRDRWALEAWADFGTPAPVRAAGQGFLALPDGRVVRAADGAVVAEGLGDAWYVGPGARDDVVVWVSGQNAEANQRRGGVPVHAVRLVASPGGGVRAASLWRRTLPTQDLFYTAPVIHEGKVWVVSRSGVVYALDADSGEVLMEADLLASLGGWVYASPLIAGDALLAGGLSGQFLRIPLGSAGSPSPWLTAGAQVRATPSYAAGAWYVRTLDGLARWEVP
jgi:outer membrane protein assembly factor BamB